MTQISSYLELAEKRGNQWWRFVIVVFVIIGFFLTIANLPLDYYLHTADVTLFSTYEYIDNINNLNIEALHLSKNIALILMIVPFGIAMVCLFLFVRYLHKRSIGSLLSIQYKIRWSHLVFGFGFWIVGMIVMLILDFWVNGQSFHWQFQWNQFLPLLIICLTLLPLQTSFEELFFRGYLLQAFGLISKYPWIPILISSILFAMMHLANPEVYAFGLTKMMLYYFGFGLFTAIVTILGKGIETALGIHAANNIFGALTVTYDHAVIQAPAIWKVDHEISYFSVLIYFLLFSIFIIVYFRYYRLEWSVLKSRI